MGKSIKEEIQQQSFRNNQQMVQVNIIFTSGWLQNRHLQIFKRYGMSYQQYNVLRILKGSYPHELSLGQIKSKMLDRMSDTSRIVERLFKAGYLNRTKDNNDRRVAKITISDKGLRLLKDMQKEERNLDQVTTQLEDHEAEMLSNLLDKLRGE